jgi:hypothetical protein
MADLMTAKKDAAARSLESKKTIFVTMDSEGECSVADKQSKETLHAFESGNEVPLPALMEVSKEAKPAKVKVAKASTKSKIKTKSKKTMSTEVKPAKKAAKKAAPAKKVAKTNGDKLIGKATTILLSKGDWLKVDKAVEAGKGSIRDLASKGILKAL